MFEDVDLTKLCRHSCGCTKQISGSRITHEDNTRMHPNCTSNCAFKLNPPVRRRKKGEEKQTKKKKKAKAKATSDKENENDSENDEKPMCNGNKMFSWSSDEEEEEEQEMYSINIIETYRLSHGIRMAKKINP